MPFRPERPIEGLFTRYPNKGDKVAPREILVVFFFRMKGIRWKHNLKFLNDGEATLWSPAVGRTRSKFRADFSFSLANTEVDHCARNPAMNVEFTLIQAINRQSERAAAARRANLLKANTALGRAVAQ